MTTNEQDSYQVHEDWTELSRIGKQLMFKTPEDEQLQSSRLYLWTRIDTADTKSEWGCQVEFMGSVGERPISRLKTIYLCDLQARLLLMSNAEEAVACVMRLVTV